MKTLYLLILFFISLLAINLNAQPRRQINKVAGQDVKTAIWRGTEVQFMATQLAVKITSSANQNDIDLMLQVVGGKIKNSFDDLGWGFIELTDNTDEILAIEELMQLPFVITAEPNLVVSVNFEPNDPYYLGTNPATYPHQWALLNQGQTPPGGLFDADIDAPEAWDLTTGSSNVIIAILDSGIPLLNGILSHPDLDDPNKIILGPDFIYDAQGVKDEYGHGTHVAGITAAESNNGIGITGVAWNCKILVTQVFDEYGNGTYESIYNAIRYAADYQREGTRVVINISGGAATDSQLWRDAIVYAQNQSTGSVPIIAAAGNNNWHTFYPAAYSLVYSNVIAVSATSEGDIRASYSNFGPEINVAAPGGWGVIQDGNVFRYNTTANLGRNIFSTTPNYPFNLQFDPLYENDPYSTDISQNYGYIAGTSMAAPHVAGVAALILSLNPTLTAEQVRKTIELSSDDKGLTGRDDLYGYGRINADKAVHNIYVPQVYTTIYGALLNAKNGQNVILAPGVYHVIDDLVVPNGVNLVVNQGTTIYFWNNHRLNINGGGKLTVNGTIFQGGGGSPGSWHSITFYGNSSGYILNSTIKDAQCGIYVPNNANVSIVNSTIENNSIYGISALNNSILTISGSIIQNNGTGVRVYSSFAQIFANNILNNINYGILADNINSHYWYENTLQGNGIAMLLNNSTPFIFNNYISENAHGVVINSSSSIVFGNPEDPQIGGYNAITCAAIPLFRAQNYSTVYMGDDYQGGNNSIFGSELPDMEALNNTGIYAFHNYWGINEPAVYADATSWILTKDPLGEDPVPSCFNKNSPVAKLIVPSEDSTNVYWQAMAEAMHGNIPRAKELLLQLISGNFDYKYSPLALLAFHDFSFNYPSRDSLELIHLLTKIYNRVKSDPLRPFAIRLFARINAHSNYFDKMLFYNTELIDSYQNSNNELVALYDLITYYAEIENDQNKAQALFARMLNSFPEEDLTKYAAINLGNNFETINKPGSVLEIPKAYYLDNAFPNPFNPATIIRYELPENGIVQLKIFDLLGNEVSTLVNDYQNKGRYSVKFNASNLASGIYIYRLQSRDFTASKKIILMK